MEAHIRHADCVEGLRAGVGTDSARLVICDPPYDIGVGGEHWDSIPDYMGAARGWLAQCARVLVPGGALLLYGSPCRQHHSRMCVMLEDELGLRLVQHLPWVYRQGGDARLRTMREYAVRHEQLAWFEKPGGARVFRPLRITDHYSAEEKRLALAKGPGRVTDESLSRGRPPRTFIDIPRVNSRSRERAFGAHPSMKPLALCERLVLAHSDEGDLVVVPFCGSGSEVVAAHALGRRVVGFETSERYVAIANARLDAARHGAVPPPPVGGAGA